MVYVACIGDEEYNKVYIVGVYTTRENALEAGKEYLNKIHNSGFRAYTEYWLEEHVLDKKPGD